VYPQLIDSKIDAWRWCGLC